MAYEIPGFSFTLPSAADYRTGNGQFRFTTVNSSGKAVAPAASGDLTIGVRQNTPNQNEGTTIVNSGISMVEAGGVVAAGDKVQSDATGRAIAAASGKHVAGIALEAASGAGIIIAVLLTNTATPVA